MFRSKRIKAELSTITPISILVPGNGEQKRITACQQTTGKVFTMHLTPAIARTGRPVAPGWREIKAQGRIS